jgi:ATP-binding cassette subfamily B multidrug efflux pump
LSPTARVLSYVRQLRGQYVAGAVFTLAYASCFQLVPLAVRDVVARIEGGQPLQAVLQGVWYLAGATLLVSGIRLASRFVLFRAAREIEYRIRNDFLVHLQRLPESFFNANRTGDLMSRAVNDITSVRLFLGMGLMNIVQTPVLYLGALGVMAAIDWRLTFWVVLPYPLFILFGRVFGRRMHAANLAVQEQLGQLANAVQENASGVLVVRSYAMESQQEARFEVQNQKLAQKHVRVATVNMSMMPMVAMLPAIAMILVLFVGGARVRQGFLSTSDLWAFFIYIFMLTMPTFMMGWVITLVQRGLASLQRLGEVLDTVPTIRDEREDAGVDRIAGSVRLNGLGFSYPDQERRPALLDVSFEVEQGQTVGVVGPVGAGKSTLVNLVPRVLEVPDGSLFIDGVDVNCIPLRVLRSSIAMVPQDSFLFSTTIAENIRFGLPEASIDEVREAARRAHVLDEIEDFVQGLETLVGERGITLSGGQRQRIALARALLLRPAILILDDALSSVDAEAEEAILRDLREARAGRTCFIVAHRLSAVRDADLIVVMAEDGRVEDRGTHAELIERDGFYARLYRQQQLEAEIAENAVP